MSAAQIVGALTSLAEFGNHSTLTHAKIESIRLTGVDHHVPCQMVRTAISRALRAGLRAKLRERYGHAENALWAQPRLLP
jgi:hypothetical protein